MAKVFNTDILQGKVAFVTGGGTGITGGVARAFAEHGAKLAIVSRKEDNLIPKKQFIEENGGECLAVAADVREYDAVETCDQADARALRPDRHCRERCGRQFSLCAADQLSANGFGTVVDIDTKGTFNVCRAAFEALKEIERPDHQHLGDAALSRDADADTRLGGKGRRRRDHAKSLRRMGPPRHSRQRHRSRDRSRTPKG